MTHLLYMSVTHTLWFHISFCFQLPSNSPFSTPPKKNKNNKANPTYFKWQLHARFQPKVIFFLPVVSWRTDGICNGSGYILFLSVICFYSSAVDLAIRGKCHENFVFYMLNKPRCFKPLQTLSPIANAQQPPCSACLLMQCFLSAYNKEQPASGSADSAEH